MARFTFAAITLAAIPAPLLAGDGLEMFDAVAGQCLTADVGEGGRDTHCFSALFGGRHLRDVHHVTIDGKVVYRGETTYSRDGDKVTFTYINSLGGGGRGEAHAVRDGIAITGSMRANPEAGAQSMNSHWTLHQTGGYDVSDGSGRPVHYLPDTK